MSNRFFELASASALAAAIVFHCTGDRRCPDSVYCCGRQTGRGKDVDSAAALRTASRICRAYFTNASVIPLERPKDLGARNSSPRKKRRLTQPK